MEDAENFSLILKVNSERKKMKWSKSGILFMALLSTAVTAPTPFEDSLRLPRSSFPLNYELTINAPGAHFGQRPFSGTVRISVEIAEDTDTITLHNRELNIQSVKLSDSGSQQLAQTYELESEKEFLHIHASSRLLVRGERVSVEISFSGQLQLNMIGFYRSSYKVNGATRFGMHIG